MNIKAVLNFLKERRPRKNARNARSNGNNARMHTKKPNGFTDTQTHGHTHVVLNGVPHRQARVYLCKHRADGPKRGSCTAAAALPPFALRRREIATVGLGHNRGRPAGACMRTWCVCVCVLHRPSKCTARTLFNNIPSESVQLTRGERVPKQTLLRHGKCWSAYMTSITFR